MIPYHIYRYERLKKNHMCVRCKAVLPNESTLARCEKCNNKKKKYDEKYRLRKRSEGYCSTCLNRMAKPEMKTCEYCLAKKSEYYHA